MKLSDVLKTEGSPMGGVMPTKLKLSDVTGPKQPGMDAPREEWDAFYRATVKPNTEPSPIWLFQSEIVSPIASGLSTGLTAGLAKEGIGAISPELKETLFPEQKTILGKGIRAGSELAGVLAGAPAKLTIGAIRWAAKAFPKCYSPG